MKTFPVTRQLTKTFNNISSILRNGKTVLNDTDLLKEIIEELTNLNINIRDEIEKNMDDTKDQKTFDAAIDILNEVDLRGIDLNLWNMEYLTTTEIAKKDKGNMGKAISSMSNDLREAGYLSTDNIESAKNLLLVLYVIFRSRVESVFNDISKMIDDYHLSEQKIGKYFLSTEKIAISNKKTKSEFISKEEIRKELFPYFKNDFKISKSGTSTLDYLVERIMGFLKTNIAKDFASIALLIMNSSYFIHKPGGGFQGWYKIFTDIVKCKTGKYDNTNKLMKYSLDHKFDDIKSYL